MAHFKTNEDKICFWKIGNWNVNFFLPWDVLSLGTFCLWDILSLGHFVSWDVLSLGPYVWGRFVLGRFVLGRFVLGSFVCAPYIQLLPKLIIQQDSPKHCSIASHCSLCWWLNHLSLDSVTLYWIIVRIIFKVQVSFSTASSSSSTANPWKKIALKTNMELPSVDITAMFSPQL